MHTHPIFSFSLKHTNWRLGLLFSITMQYLIEVVSPMFPDIELCCCDIALVHNPRFWWHFDKLCSPKAAQHWYSRNEQGPASNAMCSSLYISMVHGNRSCATESLRRVRHGRIDSNWLPTSYRPLAKHPAKRPCQKAIVAQPWRRFNCDWITTTSVFIVMSNTGWKCRRLGRRKSIMRRPI